MAFDRCNLCFLNSDPMPFLNMMVWADFFIYVTVVGTHFLLGSEDQMKEINGEYVQRTCVRDCEFNS